MKHLLLFELSSFQIELKPCPKSLIFFAHKLLFSLEFVKIKDFVDVLRGVFIDCGIHYQNIRIIRLLKRVSSMDHLEEFSRIKSLDLASIFTL